ncbi:hypothetical protein BDB01DRAFT_774947 [Pilobolus umbonatus]|nr:hypothetical protein BDB01DRAFT_774947 [Pilobolus umbonatus]
MTITCNELHSAVAEVTPVNHTYSMKKIPQKLKLNQSRMCIKKLDSNESSSSDSYGHYANQRGRSSFRNTSTCSSSTSMTDVTTGSSEASTIVTSFNNDKDPADLLNALYILDEDSVCGKWANSKGALLDIPREKNKANLLPPSYAQCNKIESNPKKVHAGEQLPQYSCTVQKMGKGKMKFEYDAPGKRARKRHWRKIYMELCGTVLKINELKSNTKSYRGYRYLPTFAAYYQHCVRYTPLIKLSLSNAKVDLAPDYKKRTNVFRITTEIGPQVLIEVQTLAELSGWMEKLSAGLNIALDLENRSMPSLTHVRTVPTESNTTIPLNGCYTI